MPSAGPPPTLLSWAGSGLPALLLAVLVLVDPAAHATTTSVVIDLTACVLAAVSGQFPLHATVAVNVLLWVATPLPDDVTYAVFASLICLAMLVAQGAWLWGVVAAASQLGLAVNQALTSQQAPEVGLREAAAWGVLIAVATLLGLLLRGAERATRGRLARAESGFEEQRHQIARDLHDTVSRTNARIALRVEALRGHLEHEGVSAEALAELHAITLEARDNATALRSMLTTLNAASTAPVTRHRSLRPSLDDAQRRLRSHGFTPVVQTLLDPNVILAAPIEDLACRILGEATHNVIKYGERGEVRIMTETSPVGVGLLIVNAVSPETRRETLRSGFGLAALKAESLRIGGDLQAGVVGGRWQVSAHLPGEGS